MASAILLIIGDEVLNGNTLDTNSNFAARQLSAAGINLRNIITVADTPQAIREGLEYALSRADLVISTGGLGPTRDDVTKQVIADYFGMPLEMHPQAVAYLEERYARMNRPLNHINRMQALVPKGCRVFLNEAGSAPILWIDHQKTKVYIAMPGVPSEMQHMLQNVVIHELKRRFGGEAIVIESILTVGISESSLAERFAELEDEIEAANTDTEHYKLAYLPSLSLVRLQLQSQGQDETVLRKNVHRWKTEIERLAGNYIYGYGNDTLTGHIGQLLRSRRLTLALAESCTGGLLAQHITSMPGSSDYFEGSLVTYSYELKHKVLGVPQQVFDEHGSVSSECVSAMLEGLRRVSGADYGIATSGIAGPGGATPEKPVGLVWIGLYSPSGEHTIRSFRFSRTRTENIQMFSINAFDMLRRHLKGLPIK